MTKEINNQNIILTAFLGGAWSYAYYFKGQVFIEAFENYQKRSTRNKCYIKTAQGKKSLIVPLKSGKNQQQSIQDVRIAYEEDWIKEFRHGLETNYSASPYLQYYLPEILSVIDTQPEYLWELNWELNQLILHFLDIDQGPQKTKEWLPNYDEHVVDLRNVKSTNQDGYQYPQLFEEKGLGFMSNLSILDLLFCCGPEARIHLIQMAENI